MFYFEYRLSEFAYFGHLKVLNCETKFHGFYILLLMQSFASVLLVTYSPAPILNGGVTFVHIDAPYVTWFYCSGLRCARRADRGSMAGIPEPAYGGYP